MKVDKGAKSLTTKGAMQAIVLIAAIVGPFLLARYYVTAYSFDSNTEPVFLSLEREAAEVNATLPEMVSDGVRLDKASAGPDNSFIYSYTIVDDSMAKSMTGDTKKLHELKAQLRERVCTGMAAFRANGTIVTYSLKDNAGVVIADISINPRDC